MMNTTVDDLLRWLMLTISSGGVGRFWSHELEQCGWFQAFSPRGRYWTMIAICGLSGLSIAALMAVLSETDLARDWRSLLSVIIWTLIGSYMSWGQSQASHLRRRGDVP